MSKPFYMNSGRIASQNIVIHFDQPCYILFSTPGSSWLRFWNESPAGTLKDNISIVECWYVLSIGKNLLICITQNVYYNSSLTTLGREPPGGGSRRGADYWSSVQYLKFHTQSARWSDGYLITGSPVIPISSREAAIPIPFAVGGVVTSEPTHYVLAAMLVNHEG